jgi:hypothetical protein
VDGMVSVSKPLKVSSSMKGPKMLSGSEVRSVRVFHSHPSWAIHDRRHMKRDLLQSCHTYGTR